MANFPVSPTRRRLLAAGLGLAAATLSRHAGAEPAAPAATDQESIESRLGEMIIMGFWGGTPSASGARALAGWIGRGLVGGVIYFDDNLPSPAMASRFNRLFQDAAGRRKLFLGVDQEGGAVVRLRQARGFEALPAAETVAGMPRQEAEALYNHAAEELHRLGFNLNFGPVVDLAVNRKSQIIAGPGRSYGTDPAVVVEYAKIFIDAHRRNHVLTALKHFPGHGSTALDSHVSLPDITATWRREELQPFAELTNSGYADMVMIGHLVHADLTEPHRPASLSPGAVQGLLRSTIGYDGLVVSDDMQMGALRHNFSPEDSIIFGIAAGVDVFLYSNREHADAQMPERFHHVVRTAIARGRLDPARIQQSLNRIARLKRLMPTEAAAWRGSRA